MHSIVLASSSVYRQAQFSALGIPVTAVSPDISESPLTDEPAPKMAARLAAAKAGTIACRYSQAIVIGCDQVASVEYNDQTHTLGKPGNHARAMEQLLMCQGRTVVFFTAVCVHYQGRSETCTDITEVTFRSLSEQQIHRYLLTEKPYDCAGSFKAEGKGILLFDRISSRDPNSLIGLPVILLQEMLLNRNIDMLDIATLPAQAG